MFSPMEMSLSPAELSENESYDFPAANDVSMAGSDYQASGDGASMISKKEQQGKKKMPDAELSQHPESVKRRRRVAGLDLITAAVDKVKNADRAARRYVRNRVRASDAFRRATVEKQREMVKEAEERVIRKRVVEGKTARQIAQRLRFREEGGRYAQVDDGNPAWEDTEFDSDDEDVEAIWRANDLVSGFTIVKKFKEETIQNAKAAKSELTRRMMLIAFCAWQRKWRGHISSLDKKLRALTRHGPYKLYYEIASGKILNYEPSHDYFTIGERAIWRNMMGWQSDPDDPNYEELMASWITLPGPAYWWPDDYDYESHGFALPQGNIGQEDAFELVLNRSWKWTGNAPLLWEQVLPSESELGVVGNIIEGQMLLNMFNGLV